MKNNEDSDLDNLLFYLALVLALWLLSPSSAEAANDKQLHVVASALMAGTAVVYLEDKVENPIAWSIAASMAVGVVKEAYDAAHPQNHRAEVGDLVADFLGASVGALVGNNVMIRLSGDRVAVGVKVDF